ncbi:MDR family MFS transporter [Candidatus Solirubrobacter pratensis]|uniref:MDR family MFS transporter n=1 Tax=Candidatus Solirubrobacter pratensis TaxID=1298857 RepID=UPI00047FE141|nr:MDR family MFS transporter [Candidatus Solirubrobacter pratensis]
MSAQAAPPQSARVGVVFTGLVLVMLLAALDGTIVATALPTIVGELGGLEHISWITSAYLLAQTAVTPLYGKLGDLYGRKRVLQIAIVVFLAGSALCGLAQSMTALIAFRAVQGLGAGGLIVLTQATVGDIVPPRERGKYQGIFGGVFGLASVAGPLLGGLIVEHTSWRWVFYVNLPIGLVALVVLAITLPAAAARAKPAIDYLGAGLLAAGLAGIVLVTSLGGTTWAWGSADVVLTAAIGVGCLLAFTFVETRASEPVLPPALWRERVFAVAGALSLIVGFALFGAVTFLPLYFQTVDAASPTGSGLRLLPMMLGVLVTSIGSGQAISRLGRYKMFPIGGTAVMAIGLVLLSRLGVGTSTLEASLYLLVLGLGLGMVMQVLILAVQNAVPYAVLGAATSGVTLMRGIGGSLGTAVFGSIFTNRLTARLTGGDLPPALRQIVSGGGRLTGAQVEQLPAPARLAYEQAYVHALTPVFLVAACVAALGFLLAWLLPEKPLRATAATSTGLDDSLAAPKAPDSLAEIEKALSMATTLEQRRRFRAGVADRARLDVSPGGVWALVQLNRRGVDGARAEARRLGVSEERIRQVDGELRADGLVDDGGITARGTAYADQLFSARREALSELLDDRDAERRPEVSRLLQALSRELVGERP